MSPITISKKLIKNDDLVIIPRKEYDALIRVVRKQIQPLDKELAKALEEVEEGKTIGPFSNVKDLLKSLEQ